MDARQEMLERLQPIIVEQLGVQQDQITEKSTWIQLGADSLDRLGLSMAIEDAFEVKIPHSVGERLNTVGDTTDHLLTVTALLRGGAGSQIFGNPTAGMHGK
jgi:acyl carrier protein